MKIAIIEDEKITARDLAATLQRLFPQIEVVKILASVREGVAWFATATTPALELIFADIQLGDGTSFDIFSQTTIKAPVIFCTAYDEYALEAFGANGIDYILKPFTDDTVRTAVEKYLSFRESISDRLGGGLRDLETVFATQKRAGAAAILVYQQDKILPISIDDAAFFYYNNGVVTVITFDNTKYTINKSMDEIARLTEPGFFRANRQFLVNRKSVLDVSNYLSRKLSLRLKIQTPEDITVSREKMTAFLKWLTSHT